MSNINSNLTKKIKLQDQIQYEKDNVVTAILVDGGFYRKRVKSVYGDLSPKEFADKLEKYCKRHLSEKMGQTYYSHSLYRIFYYDCMPTDMVVYHPYTKKDINLKNTDVYLWTIELFNELRKRRKFALRLGELSIPTTAYKLSNDKVKALFTGKLDINDITEKDFILDIGQKGVDMKIGVDIASLSFKKQVNQIVLIAGDSDFVPAAKLARREGIDFILDPLGAKVKDSLFEHIDGLNTVNDDFKHQYKIDKKIY